MKKSFRIGNKVNQYHLVQTKKGNYKIYAGGIPLKDGDGSVRFDTEELALQRAFEFHKKQHKGHIDSLEINYI